MSYTLAFLIDIGFLIMNVVLAIMNRGEWIGWLFTALALWQIMGMISAVKSVYEED